MEERKETDEQKEKRLMEELKQEFQKAEDKPMFLEKLTTGGGVN